MYINERSGAKVSGVMLGTEIAMREFGDEEFIPDSFCINDFKYPLCKDTKCLCATNW